MASRILLADGNITAQNLGKKILTQAGYDVVTVSNGVAAVKKIADLHPEVAVLDIYMPGYSGIEVCEKAKAAPETAKIAILLTVGKTEPFRVEEAIRVKADGIITKPFDTRDLTIVVARLVDRVSATQPCGESTGLLSKNPAAQLQTSTEVVNKVSVRSERIPPEPSRIVGGAHSTPIPEAAPPIFPSDSAATGRRPSPPSRPDGSEVCDVCGCVNTKGSYACCQCDVPLPSSMSPSR